MDILRLAALAVTAALCAMVLRREAGELSVLLALAAGILLLGGVVDAMGEVRDLAFSFADAAGLPAELWEPVWKTAGIGIVTKLTASVCRDAGEGGVAAFLETAGAAAALLAVLPLVRTVFDLLEGL